MVRYKKLLKQAAKTVDYWSHLAMRSFVRDLGQRMDNIGMKRADLAREIQASTAYVTKVMRGDANFTLETMTKLAMAVNGRLEVRIVDLGAIDKSSNLRVKGWHFEQGLQKGVSTKSVVVQLAPDQVAANERFHSGLQLTTRRVA